MTLLSIGDLAQNFMLRRHTGSLKTELQTLSQEMTTGLVSDVAARAQGDFAPLAALTASLSQLRAFRATTDEAALFTGAMQSALDVVDTIASDLSPALLHMADTRQAAAIDSIGTDAHQKFRTAVATLNTRLGDRALFAGNATDGMALADADTILTALDGAIFGAISAADVETAIDDWFADPLGFDSIAYQGGAPLDPLQIAPGDQVSLAVTAQNDGIRDTLKGLAMAAMLDRGALSGSLTARVDLAKRAGESLASSQTGRSYLAGGVGVVENRIATAQARNGAEATALDIARVGLMAADPYETAAAMEETQTQLETLYAVTARLSRLNLMDFLR